MEVIITMSIELNNDQIHAVYAGETWYKNKTKQVFEISGPAGSGKTTLILYLIERLGLKLNNVLFLAYMGKAACRMALNGLPARTIHSAIYDYVKKYERDENGNVIKNENGKPKKVGKFVLKENIKKGTKLIVIDEGSCVNKEIPEDLLSYGIPVIVLGDLNQLPPVFGNSYFLRKPDVELHQIMRQNEDNPIIYLSQRVLNGQNLEIGVYGKSEIFPRHQIKEFHFSKSDIVLTETNRLRWNVNNFFREELRNYKQLDYPHVGEKLICRKNNWSRCIDKGIYLTNGTSGYVSDIFKNSFNKKTMTMDFRPDFTHSIFKNVVFNYPYLYMEPPSIKEEGMENKEMKKILSDTFSDRFEFGYAITVHLSQGSQYNKVLYLNENMMHTKEDRIKIMYTAITRAVDSISIAI